MCCTGNFHKNSVILFLFKLSTHWFSRILSLRTHKVVVKEIAQIFKRRSRVRISLPALKHDVIVGIGTREGSTRGLRHSVAFFHLAQHFMSVHTYRKIRYLSINATQILPLHESYTQQSINILSQYQ